MTRDCEENLGLEDAERGALTGFTRRAAQALAHLREAWLVADTDNARAVEAAIAELFNGHSFQRNRGLFERVLIHGMDDGQAATLLMRLRPHSASCNVYDAGPCNCQWRTP